MGKYVLKRMALIVPTLFGIILINFVIVQFAPGGPIEQIIAQVTTGNISTTSGISGGGDSGVSTNAAASEADVSGTYGLDPDLIADLEKQFGFDKPAHERFLDMVWNYMRFDFGMSFFQDRPVLDLVLERIPVSISLGLWSLLIVYGISIPLGIAKAIRDGTKFDLWTSSIIFVGYAIPGFLFAILLIVVFAGGNYFDIFPLRGLASDNWDELSWPDKILDYFWHLALPVTALTIGGFATLTMLTKNSFLEEINKQFVLTARSKGLTERRVLYGHVFRNAMLIVIAGFPSAFVSIFFTGSVLIEVIFSLDGMGLLSYEAIIKRDYPILFGTVFCFTLIGLVMHLVGDLTYVLVDPRIDFETRGD
ncbi:MAG: microcin ABC transporter permease [Gammaproteobacteria bacterium]|nr:microcin ABC transporter permease [Gammaproteobacteria bacterium]RPG24696.1 MAG: microcin C ABC transporter permease YejB [Gammaproteobacteria bacterium TMED50]|tara:strand:- start:20459 stop:21550 length:1092 start_codon:yes stop_codon:yes gene_type:complete